MSFAAGAGAGAGAGALESVSLRNMSDGDLAKARFDHLECLRKDAAPLRRQQFEDLERYVSGVDGPTAGLGAFYTELVFFDEKYECKPASYKHWPPNVKEEHERSLRRYRQRVKSMTSGGAGIQSEPFEKLAIHEKETLLRFIEILRAYVDTIESCTRDIEIGFQRPHPTDLTGICHLQKCPIKPLVYSRYDAELSRRILVNTDASEMEANPTQRVPTRCVPDGWCSSCQTDDYVVSTVESSRVCTMCGLEVSSRHIDNTIESIPYENRQDYMAVGGGKGAYEMTANFLKTLDRNEATPNHKVPRDVMDFVALRIKGRSPSINLIRHILKQGGHQKHYPEAVCILASVTDTEVPKSTQAERNQIHRMHVQYCNAFSSIPENIRKRSSSLTNNYLIARFKQMMGLLTHLRFIKMLKCEKKMAEHDRVFKLIVQRVRETSDAAAVASGTSYWQYLGPLPS